MKERERKLAHSFLCEVLDYNPLTGVFYWKKCNAKWLKPGDVAGCCSNGYWLIGVNRARYAAHRLAWFYVYGKWPEHELDHINLNRTDNRIANLREVTHADNMRNVKIRKHNSVGFKGVIRTNRWSRRYVARITVSGKQIHIGTYDTPEQAHAAYVKASIVHHGEYGRVS